MDLTYSLEDIAYRDRVRGWFAAHKPQGELKTLAERKAWIRQLYNAGYVGMGWPKEYGGQDARPMEQAIVADEMARVNAPGGSLGLGLGIVGPTIVHHGTPEQKARFLQETADRRRNLVPTVSPSRTPARTWRACARAPRTRATISPSTGRRSGRVAAIWLIGAC